MPSRSAGGVDEWPDLDGPMPDGWDPKDWTISILRKEQIPYADIGDRLGISRGNVSARIMRMRRQFGPDWLKGKRPTNSLPNKRAGAAATAARWDEIRKANGIRFGTASVKAAEMVHRILDRYLEDDELLNALTIADAVDLAKLAKSMGGRADEMIGQLPHETPDLGPRDLFNAIDGAVATSRTSVTLQKIELIVGQFSQGDQRPQQIEQGDDDEVIEVEAGAPAVVEQ